MKNSLFSILLLFVFATGLNAQFSGSKWYIVEDAEDKIVFIDTSSVRQTDNLLSVWSMVDYREPVFSATVEKKIKRVKTKYLFNTTQHNFTVIGTIFYDETGKLITDSEIPQLTGGNEDAYLDIEDGTSIEKVYDKSNIYYLTGNINADPSEYLSVREQKGELPLQDSTLITETEPEKEIPQETELPAEEDTTSVLPEITEPEIITPPVETPPVTTIEEEEQPEETAAPGEYNQENEKAVRNTIFTDGNLYCYQVSSWKRKNIAEQETRKLKDKGFDAFIMEAEIPGRGTWYRVRVGYFQSLDEALASQRKSK